MDVVFTNELTPDTQERFVAWRREVMRRQGHSASNGTIIRDLGFVKAALRLAHRGGQLQSVPYIITLPQPAARDRFLTAEECQRLLDACDQPYVRRFVLLALHTLQRPKAIFQLRTNQVDLLNNRIDFLKPGTIQSNKRRPVVPITATLRQELAVALEESITGYVLEKDGIPLKSMRKAFATAVRKAGLPSETTPYVLRHTGATILAAAGVPMHQIASMLGHTNQRTTEIYAKRRPEFLAEAVDTLERVFAQNGQETTPSRDSSCTLGAREGGSWS